MSRNRASATHAFLTALGGDTRFLFDIIADAGLDLEQGCDVLRRGLASGHLRLTGNGNRVERVQP